MGKRGFGGMDRARVREIAASGGRSAHAQGKAHVFTVEEAQAAGRKGGLTKQARLRAARIAALAELTESAPLAASDVGSDAAAEE